MPLDEYREANRANWSDRVAVHWEPDGYDAPGFIADPERLSTIVEFDHQYLGDVAMGEPFEIEQNNHASITLRKLADRLVQLCKQTHPLATLLDQFDLVFAAQSEETSR